MFRRRYAALFLLPVVLVLLNGCPFVTSPGKNNSGGGGGDPGYKPQTSIDNVLYNLKKSYNDMNYLQYTQLFDPAYTYIFAPQDIGGPDNNPPTWGLADEKISAQHLFSKTDPNKDGYIAVSTNLTFQQGPQIPNDISTWTKVVLSQIFLTVTTRQKDTSDPLDYLVQGDQANLWFIQDGAYWYIRQWEDKPIGAAAAARPLVVSK